MNTGEFPLVSCPYGAEDCPKASRLEKRIVMVEDTLEQLDLSSKTLKAYIRGVMAATLLFGSVLGFLIKMLISVKG